MEGRRSDRSINRRRDVRRSKGPRRAIKNSHLVRGISRRTQASHKGWPRGDRRWTGDDRAQPRRDSAFRSQYQYRCYRAEETRNTPFACPASRKHWHTGQRRCARSEQHTHSDFDVLPSAAQRARRRRSTLSRLTNRRKRTTRRESRKTSADVCAWRRR